MKSATDRMRWASYRRRRWGRRRYGAFLGGSAPTVTFAPGTPLRVRAWIALAPDFTRPWWEWNWADVTDYVRWDPGVATSQGRRDQDGQPVASTARATLDNSDGRFSRLNPYSPYYGLLTPFTPIRFAVDPGTGFNHRYFGFVNSWPKRWDRSANDPTIPIVCRGPLHRVLRSQRLGSALFRSMSGVAPGDYVPHEYWSAEDGANATQIGSANGGAPASYTGTVNFASDTDLTGSEPLPTLASGAVIFSNVRAYSATDRWIFQWFVKIDAKPANMTTIFEASTTGTATTFRVVVDPLATAAVRLYLLDASGVSMGESEIELNGSDSAHPSEADFFGSWATIMVASSQDSPADPLAGWLGLSVTPEMPSSGGVLTVGTHGAITQARLYAGEGCSVGHWGIWTDPAFNPVSDASVNAAAMLGYAGEMAHTRIARLCREASITLHYTTATSALLGPQSTGRLLTVLQDSAKAAQGVLYEYEFGLGYQDVSDRYNQTVAMTIDIADGQVVDDLEPADDDLRFHNQWTASRRDGSSATVQADGSLTTADLEYAGADTFDVATDGQLDHVAGWLLHTDNRNEDYWPNVVINLAKHPSLITDWLALPYGARINVTNLMAEAGVDTIDAIVEGHMEHWNSLQWSARLNTSPASVYTVGVLDAQDSRLDSGSSTLSAAVDTVTTSLVVVTTAADSPWVTAAAEFPFDIETLPGPVPDTSGGEVMTVTAISGASSPQTFTVTRSTNGVVKAHAAGTRVRVRDAFVLAY